MNENFLYIDSKDILIDNIESGDITPSDDLVVFIEDTKEIWTHGSYFDCKNLKELNIATINGQSLIEGGDITIEGGSLTESDIAAMGFTKNTGTYSKPSTGIPKSDLASAVQTSLGKADTALQSYTEQYKGTITGVSANGASVATSGVANIPAASTSAYGVTKLSSATNSTSTTLAATPSAVKSAYDLANGKYTKPNTGIPFSDFEEQVQGSIIKAEEAVQSVSAGVEFGDVSAGNFFKVNKDANGNVSIKMIQNTLASGKTAIPYTTDVKQYIDNAVANAGGGGGTGGSANRIQWTADVLEAASGIIQLEPFVVYYGGEFHGGNVTINPNLGTGNHYQEYRCIFYVSVAPTMYLGVDVWANGKTPEIKSNRWYELSIAFDSYVGITFGVLTEFLMPE